DRATPRCCPLGALHRDVGGGRPAKGGGHPQRRGTPPREPATGLRQDVAEDLQGATGGCRRLARRGRRGLARAFPRDLRFRRGFSGALGGPGARRGRAARWWPHRRDGALRGRGVLYLHDARGASFLGLDHLFRLPGRGRHDGGPGPIPHPRQRPSLRADDARWNERGREPAVAGHPAEPGGALRGPREGGDEGGLRGPRATVAPLQEPPPQRPDPLDAPRLDRAAAVAASSLHRL
ncbi:MAG: hypothetical protein AVDCRST_MAG03-1035, partial [uncultured Rubrobacteraceae bacterium]